MMMVCGLGIVSGNPRLQPLKSHPQSRHAALNLFPVGTPDVLCRGTSQHYVTGLPSTVCLLVKAQFGDDVSSAVPISLFF